MHSHIQALQAHLEQLTNLQSAPSSFASASQPYPASPPYRDYRDYHDYRDDAISPPPRAYSATSAGSSGRAAPHLTSSTAGTIQIKPMHTPIDTSHEPSTIMRERAWHHGSDTGTGSPPTSASGGVSSPLGSVMRPAGRGAQRMAPEDVASVVEHRISNGGGHNHHYHHHQRYPHTPSESSDSSQTLPQNMLSNTLSPPRKSFTAVLGRKTRFAAQSQAEPMGARSPEPSSGAAGGATLSPPPPHKEGKKLTRLLRSTVTARRTDDDGPHVIYPAAEGKFKQGPGRGRMYIKDSTAGRPPYPT